MTQSRILVRRSFGIKQCGSLKESLSIRHWPGCFCSIDALLATVYSLGVSKRIPPASYVTTTLKLATTFFSDCSFTRSIWRPLLRKIGLTSPSDSWDDTAQAVTNFTGTVHHIFLTRIAWQLVIYETWRERNHLLHHGSFKGSESLFSLIERTITNRISSFRQDNP